MKEIHPILGFERHNPRILTLTVEVYEADGQRREPTFSVCRELGEYDDRGFVNKHQFDVVQLD